ncbi:MAG: hypothetical protein MJA84_17140, partial [Firmicutes bacterium]|nr:hypothetical protein [Bacillota bacterium]
MKNAPDSVLAPIASLKLTVALFAASMFLIFAGTGAQRFAGNWTVVDTYFRTFITWIELRDLAIFVPNAERIQGAFPFPGGYVLGGLLLINLLTAHLLRFHIKATGARLFHGSVLSIAGTIMTVTPGILMPSDLLSSVILSLPGMLLLGIGMWLLFGKRGGIVLIHAGVVLLIVGEFVTAAGAIESQMMIPVGAATNYSQDIREAELAIIRPGDEQDDVIAIPESLLVKSVSKGKPITADNLPDDAAQLPFDVQVLDWMDNSQLLGPMQADNRPRKATQGIGRQVVAEPLEEVSGVEEQVVDAPSVYVRLNRGEEELGVWLLSAHLAQPQSVEVNGQPYLLELRFKRLYKPYTIQLIEFKHDRFVGTSMARNFSSRIILIDPTTDTNREARISMN